MVFPAEIQCPMCAETIKGAAKICRFCKADLSEWKEDYIKKAQAFWGHIKNGHEKLNPNDMLATAYHHENNGNAETAKAYFHLVVKKYPNTEAGEAARKKIG